MRHQIQDFDRDVKRGHERDADFVAYVARRWPGYELYATPDRSEANRRGVDYELRADGWTSIKIDLKTIDDEHPNVLVEIVSSKEDHSPGWGTNPDSETDVILIHRLGKNAGGKDRWIELDAPSLHRCLERLLEDWVSLYGLIGTTSERDGRCWHSVCIPVPEHELLRELECARDELAYEGPGYSETRENREELARRADRCWQAWRQEREARRRETADYARRAAGVYRDRSWSPRLPSNEDVQIPEEYRIFAGDRDDKRDDSLGW
jgi:hypothetical protein